MDGENLINHLGPKSCVVATPYHIADAEAANCLSFQTIDGQKFHLCECIYVCVFVFINKYIYIQIYIYICVCVCVCMHRYTCIYIHPYIYLHRYVCTAECSEGRGTGHLENISKTLVVVPDAIVLSWAL